MRVQLIRRWGPNEAGQAVDVDPVQGRWLVHHAYGTATGEQAPPQAAAAPGGAGSDPVASGDATRLGPPATVKGPRRSNNAAPLSGSPAAPAPAAADASADSGKDSDSGDTGSGDAEAPAPRTRRRRKTSPSS